MKRHVQKAGIRNWYGSDFLDLQGEPLKVADRFLGQYGAFIVSGCQITANGGKYDIAPGLVMLTGTDPEGTAVQIVVPYAGTTTAQTLPLFLTLGYDVIEDTYNDGESKPVAYDYRAVATGVRPAGNYLEMKASGTPRFTDAIQDALHRFITDTERTTWNAKETTDGAQTKATTALNTAKGYTDTRESAIRTDMGTANSNTLQSAKTYTDSRETGIRTDMAAKQDKLIPGAGVTIAADGKTISAGAKIVHIDNFETFNPSSSLVDSDTGATFTLKEGESCQFKAAYNASGKPWMGSGTLGATNNPLSSIYYWSGTVTRIYGTYYMVTAYGSSTTTGQPNTATRIYYSSSRYEWVIGSDFSSRSTSGYVKLPSGVMVHWGVHTGSVSGNVSITFPVAFAATPYSCVVSGGGEPGTATIASGSVVSLTASSFSLAKKWANPDSVGWSGNPFYWIAIGTWK